MSEISLASLIPHGRVTAKLSGGALELSAQSAITSIAYNLVGETYKRHYAELPVKATIPFSLTLRIKLSHRGLILLVGDGHILFNCPCNRSVEDPVKPSGKPIPETRGFANRLPLDKFVTVKITYGKNEMQVLIDGKEALYTAKMPYMRVKEQPQLRLGIEVAKLSTLVVESIDLTELSGKTPLSRPEACIIAEEPAAEGAPFERFISRFSDEIRREILETDAVLKSQKTLKLKRTVDSSGDKLTYTSPDFGVSYIIRGVDGEWWQSFSFYVVTSGIAETWHRKADYMEEVLAEINKTDPALAERIFFALNECVGCYGSRCIVKTLYSFNGKKKLVCHGVVMLRLCSADFADVRSFFTHLNSMLERKTAEGSLQTEKIYLIK